MNSGSFDMVKLSTMWGLRPKVRQILPAVAGETFATLAMEFVDQCVEPSGGEVVVVNSMISAILSSPCLLSAPEWGASERDFTPKRAKRFAHFETVNMETSSSRAMSKSLTPSTAKRAIFTRATLPARAFLRAMTDSRKVRSSQHSSTT